MIAGVKDTDDLSEESEDAEYQAAQTAQQQYVVPEDRYRVDSNQWQPIDQQLEPSSETTSIPQETSKSSDWLWLVGLIGLAALTK